MADHLYLRTDTKGEVVALGPKLFRKQILRLGEWKHKKAPGGVLDVTKEMVAEIVKNFKAGVRDDVPVPMGHDRDALTSVGKVIGLEQREDGLYGIHEIDDPEGKVGKTLTGTSALIALNYEDSESGEQLGAVLIHNALTNAPHMKGLAPFEAVALNEDAEEAVVISLPEGSKQATQEVDMTLEELLAELEETSDDDLRKALKDKRPEFFGDPEGEPTEADKEALEAAVKEAREEVVAKLAEKGVTVSLSEDDDDDDETKVDISSAPDFVKLSERVDTLETEKSTEAAETLVDGAIHDGKFLPSQREGMLEVALAEGGIERVTKLIPEKAIVDLSELGVEAGRKTNDVTLSEEDVDDEVDRLVGSYATTGSKKKE